MSIEIVLRYFASNTDDAIEKLKDTLVSAGWTVHDDLTSGGSGYVMTSTGENNDEYPCYVHFYPGTNYIVFLLYAYWDNSTHAGTYFAGVTNTSVLAADDDGSFYIWISADKNCFVIVSYVSSYQAIVLDMIEPFESTVGELQYSITSGSNVVLQLDTDQANDFIVGREYQILGKNYREMAEVTAIDTANHQITVDSLSYLYDAGSRIGVNPHRWFLLTAYYLRAYTFTTYYTGNQNDGYSKVYENDVFTGGYISPETRTQRYWIWPLILYGSMADSAEGFTRSDSLFMKAYIDTASEHTMSVGDIDTGTSSGSNTSTTLNDMSKSWVTNEHAGKALIVTDGTGAPYFGTIASNTATELTVSPAFATTPDDTSAYTICEEGWMYFYFAGSYSYAGAVRFI